MTPERLQELQRDPGYQDVAEEIDHLTRELASVKSHPTARYVVEITQENARLREALSTVMQALVEIEHSRRDPGWFTKGESAAWQHAGEWVRKGLDAIKSVQKP